MHAIVRACGRNVVLGKVGIAVAWGRENEVLASANDSLFFRTAFHKAFATSVQKRSGTMSRTCLSLKPSSRLAASSTNSSPKEGRHHLAPTLASTTQLLNVHDPRGPSLQRWEKRPCLVEVETEYVLIHR